MRAFARALIIALFARFTARRLCRCAVGCGVGAGAIVAAREVPYSGDTAKVQVVGLATFAGDDDAKVATDVGADNPLPISQSPVDIWNVSFADSGSGLVTSDFSQRALGDGVSVSQANSNLVIAAGTTANAEFLARSERSFSGALIMRHQFISTQRIINNNLVIMLTDWLADAASVLVNSPTSISVGFPNHGFTVANVGQFMFVGGIAGIAGAVPGRYAIASIPDADTINFTVAGWPASGTGTADLFGWNWVRTLYTGATATQAAIDAQRYGWNFGDTTATINTTASPGHMMQVALDGRNAYWSDALIASSTVPTVATRGHRVVNIADPDVELRVVIWSFNGSTAPASATTFTIGFVSVEDTVNNVVYIGGSRPMGGAAPMPVSVQTGLLASTAAIGDVGTTYRANATGAASGAHIVTAASTNATVIKATAGRVVGWSLANTNAAWRYVKLHNQATAPTAGTGVVRTIAIAPNGVSGFSLDGGIAFTTGIALTTVTGAADADNTAVGANDIIGDLFFA